jgi:hypothetical protein
MCDVRYLLRPFALWWRYLPQLVALYLLGWLGREGAIELAAFVGWDNDVWASLIMPFAGIARLGSYVAMFLVLRPFQLVDQPRALDCHGVLTVAELFTRLERGDLFVDGVESPEGRRDDHGNE